MMTKTEGTLEQEKLNDHLKKTLHSFSEEKDRYVEMGLRRIAEVPQGVCIALRGRVRTENSRYFGRQLQKLLRSCLIRVVFDMKNLTYMSSTGVGELIQFIQNINNAGGEVVLADMQPKVKGVMDLLCLTGFVGLENTPEEGARVLLEHFWN